MEILELLINEVTLLVTATHLPASSFKIEAIDVGTRGSKGREVLFRESILHSCAQTDAI